MECGQWWIWVSNNACLGWGKHENKMRNHMIRCMFQLLWLPPKNYPPKFSVIRQSFIMLLFSVNQKFGNGISGWLVCVTMPTTWYGKLQGIELPEDFFILQIHWLIWLSAGAIRSSSSGPVRGDSACHSVNFPTAWWLGSRASFPRESHLETGEPLWLNLTS